MRKQVITLPKLKAAILKYHKRNLLIAQGPKTLQYEIGKYRCALATLYTKTTLHKLATQPTSLPLSAFVKFKNEDIPQLQAIEVAHDEWAAGKRDDSLLLQLLSEIG